MSLLDEIHKIIGPLAKDDFDRLKLSIERYWVINPVIVRKETGEIIDGNHRESIIKNCQRIELNIDDREAARQAVSLNLARRQLTPEQKGELIKLLRNAKFSQQEVGEMVGKTRSAIAMQEKESNVKIDNIFLPDLRIKIDKKKKTEIFNRSEKKETQIQIATDYGITRQRVGQIVKKEKEAKEKEDEIKKRAAQFDDRFDIDKIIQLGDFYELSKNIKDGSIDHIVTDPPYAEEFLPLWSQLSEVAARILRPGGFCITYSGKVHLPEVINRLSEHLKYYWQVIVVHTGLPAGVHTVKINTGYKPILIFAKPPIQPQSEYISDVIKGAGREKDQHEWQQAEGEIKIILDRLTKPKELILDPFAGTGTTIIGCLNDERQCIGIEKDKQRYEKARRRIKAILK